VQEFQLNSGQKWLIQTRIFDNHFALGFLRHWRHGESALHGIFKRDAFQPRIYRFGNQTSLCLDVIYQFSSGIKSPI
jgi:hypothetical protein